MARNKVHWHDPQFDIDVDHFKHVRKATCAEFEHPFVCVTGSWRMRHDKQGNCFVAARKPGGRKDR